MEQYWLTALVFLFAGFAQGITGFGSALVAMPVLTLFLDFRLATPLCTLCGLAITLSMSLSLKKELELGKIMPMIIGTLPGVFMGALFLKEMDESVLAAILGLILVSYSAYNFFLKPRPRKVPVPWAPAAGFLSGAIGAAMSAGGPPVVIYVTLNDWSKDKMRAVLSGYFLLGGVMTASAHALNGLTTMSVLALYAVALPAVLAGVWIGMRSSGMLSEAGYKRALYSLLFAFGIMLLAKAF